MRKNFTYRIEESAAKRMKKQAKEFGISLNLHVEQTFQRVTPDDKPKK